MTQLLEIGSPTQKGFGAGRRRKAPYYSRGIGVGNLIIGIFLNFVVAVLTDGAAADPTKLQIGDWVTECDILHETADADCFIIGVFRNTVSGGPSGSYSLLIDLRNNQIAIVGKPAPTSAILRVDRNPPLQCTGTPHCIFNSVDTAIIEQQLATGSVVLMDILTSKGPARASLSTKEYRASFAKLRAERWRRK